MVRCMATGEASSQKLEVDNATTAEIAAFVKENEDYFKRIAVSGNTTQRRVLKFFNRIKGVNL